MELSVFPVHQIHRILRIWTKISSNVRIKDRTVKMIQYGCSLLIGYYGVQLKKEILSNLQLARRTASTSRKAFWLLKSFNHISTFIDMFTNLIQHYYEETNQVIIVTKFFDLAEQFFLILYFFLENLVFLIRVNMISHIITESDIDSYTNWSGFGSDLSCFLSSAIHLFYNIINWRRLKDTRLALNQNIQEDPDIDSTDVVQSTKSSLLTSRDSPSEEEIALTRKIFDGSIDTVVVSSIFLVSPVFYILFFILQAGMELAVSMDFAHVWKRIIGRDLGDGPVGFFGFASSLLIIADNIRKAMRSNTP
jgi:hypothetical protein